MKEPAPVKYKTHLRRDIAHESNILSSMSGNCTTENHMSQGPGVVHAKKIKLTPYQLVLLCHATASIFAPPTPPCAQNIYLGFCSHHLVINWSNRERINHATSLPVLFLLKEVHLCSSLTHLHLHEVLSKGKLLNTVFSNISVFHCMMN